MKTYDWIKETDFAVTLCDRNGKILDMNQRSLEVFSRYGGSDLLGQSLLDCHPEPALTKLKQMLASPETNAYTIKKNGVCKLIYQTPWYIEGEFMGLVELSLPLPQNSTLKLK